MPNPERRLPGGPRPAPDAWPEHDPIAEERLEAYAVDHLLNIGKLKPEEVSLQLPSELRSKNPEPDARVHEDQEAAQKLYARELQRIETGLGNFFLHEVDVEGMDTTELREFIRMHSPKSREPLHVWNTKDWAAEPANADQIGELIMHKLLSSSPLFQGKRISFERGTAAQESQATDEVVVFGPDGVRVPVDFTSATSPEVIGAKNAKYERLLRERGIEVIQVSDIPDGPTLIDAFVNGITSRLREVGNHASLRLLANMTESPNLNGLVRKHFPDIYDQIVRYAKIARRVWRTE